MKKILLLFILAANVAIAQIDTVLKVTGESYPHLIATGTGSEASPFVHIDGSGGIQTKVTELTNTPRAGGLVKLVNGRYNVTNPIVCVGANISIESVSSGFNIDPNGLSQGVIGSTLICSSSGIVLGNGASPRKGNMQLRKLYLYGKGAYSAVNTFTGSAAIELKGLLDQPTLESIHIGGGSTIGTTGFDIGIRQTFSGTSNHDLAYYDKIDILGGRYGVYYNAGFYPYEKWTNSTFADNLEANFWVAISPTNVWMSLSNCTFVRGGGNSAMTTPCNVYFGGNNGNFTSCVFTDAGKNRLASTQTAGAFGLIISGNYNSVAGCNFTNNAGSAGGGLKITGNNNSINSSTFSGNTTDILITGNDNIIFCNQSVKIVDNGLRNIINYVATNSGNPTTHGAWNGVLKKNGLIYRDVVSGTNYQYNTSNPSISYGFTTTGLVVKNTLSSPSTVLGLINNDLNASLFVTGSVHPTLPQTTGFYTNATNGFSITDGQVSYFRVMTVGENAGNVGIGNSIPTSTFHINGSFATKYVAVSGDYNVQDSDETIDCNGTFDLFLPSAVGIKGRQYTIVNSGMGVITIVAPQIFTNVAGQPTTLVLPSSTGKAIIIKSTGTNWIQIQ